MSSHNGMFTTLQGLARTIANNQSRSNVIFPADVSPAYNWYRWGRNANGNNAGPSFYVTPWGQFFKGAGKTYNTDVLIKVRNLELWFCTVSGAWSMVRQKVRMQGGQYDSAFIAPGIALQSFSNDPAPLISNLVPSRFLHVFGTSAEDHYPLVDPTDIGGLITVLEAKIISASGVDISGEVGTVIGGCGCDFRISPSSSAPDGESFVGSLKPLQPYYQKFYGSSLRMPELIAKALPVGLAQLTDTTYVPSVDPDYVP